MSFEDYTDEQLESARYRFRGYQLPKIQLDSTGPSYYKVSPHPYLYNQPQYWQKEIVHGSPGGIWFGHTMVYDRFDPLFPPDGKVDPNS